jgi:hypothetical protein
MCFFVGCATGQDRTDANKMDSIVDGHRHALKDYFLCSCIDKGFAESELLAKKDHSDAVLVEMADYEPAVFRQIDSIANAVVSQIAVSNLTKKRGVMTICIDYYNGKSLADFIKSADKLMYFLKDK